MMPALLDEPFGSGAGTYFGLFNEEFEAVREDRLAI